MKKLKMYENDDMITLPNVIKKKTPHLITEEEIKYKKQIINDLTNQYVYILHFENNKKIYVFADKLSYVPVDNFLKINGIELKNCIGVEYLGKLKDLLEIKEIEK